MSNIYDIHRISNLSQYVDFISLHQKELLVCAAVRDTLWKLDVKLKEKLHGIGMTNLTIGGWVGYVFLSDQGVIKINAQSSAHKSVSEVMNEQNLKIELISRSFKDGNVAKIIINNIDFSANWRGLNIVVFDKRNMRFVDSVCFDFFPNTLVPFKRLFCSSCSYVEQEQEKYREKRIKKILPIIRVAKEWAYVQEKDLSDMANLIGKFDEV